MLAKKWNLTLVLVLVFGPGLGAGFSLATPSIVSLKVGKDKGVTRQTDSFAPQDTIYASARISNVSDPVDAKAQLSVEDIPGQKPGPIKGLEATVHLVRNGTADFNFSPPTKGWPQGKYGIEVAVLDSHGEELDHKDAEFAVH
jgi:hypothetical protein